MLVLAYLTATPAARLPDAWAETPLPDCPPEMVKLTGEDGQFCVDRFEAFLVRLDDAGHEIGVHDPNKPVYPNYRIVAKSAPGALPQAYISQTDSARACAAAGKRLCTSKEWLRACKGSIATKYPYGERRRAGACNDRGAEPLAVVFARPASKQTWGFDDMNDPRLYLVPGTVARTGQFTRCASEEGVSDMVGNLHEWTQEQQASTSNKAIMRGGYYLDTKELGEGCDYAAVGHNSTYHDYSTGFRCCKD